jgi:protocatechuate 3,4-dioxygenase beta subunit
MNTDHIMTEQERLNAIYVRSVEQMKAVVREFRITQDELHIAGDYFARLGQSGMFRSLLDVALAMTSVEATTDSAQGTRSNLEGPYHANHPIRSDGSLIDHPLADNVARLTLSGRVTDVETGDPVAGARLDFWQANTEGLYDKLGNHLRGIVSTDSEGRYRITTVVPNDYSEHDHDPLGELFRAMGKHNTRAAHIHLKASVADRVLLTTQLFMSNSSFLGRDYVEGAVSDDLIVDLKAGAADNEYTARFDVALVGAVA